MHGSPDFRTCPSNVLETAHLHNQSHVYKAPEDQMSSKQKYRHEFMPCPFTCSKMFWTGPNVLSQPKILLHLEPLQKLLC